MVHPTPINNEQTNTVSDPNATPDTVVQAQTAVENPESKAIKTFNETIQAQQEEHVKEQATTNMGVLQIYPKDNIEADVVAANINDIPDHTVTETLLIFKAFRTPDA